MFHCFRYTTVSTGLVRVQPDRFSRSFVDYFAVTFASPNFPPLTYPNHATKYAANGCPLSTGALRTYTLPIGDYFLETSSATLVASCSDFEIKLECSGGGETAAPADSNPLGFSVDANTGAITGLPERPRRDGSPYKMRLRAVDAANVRKQLPTLFCAMGK